MANGHSENYAGEAALKKGYINAEQMEECKKLQQQTQPPRSLARILLEKGYLSDEQLGELLAGYKIMMGEMLPDESDPGSISFGEAAVQKGLAKNVDVWEAMDEQARRRQEGSSHRLGDILVSKGTLEIGQAKQILESQGKKILKCTECGHQYNVRDYNPKKEYTCLNCGGALSAPEEVSSLGVEGTAVDAQTVKQTMDDKFTGKEIGGCEIIEKLGEGGMGAVYKARHRALNKVVAVKVMSSALMGEVHRKRFLREARAAAQLEHMNIVQVHDTGAHEGYNYIVMQFIDGESIQRKLTRDGKIEQKEAIRIIRAASDALGFAHKRHMIHRDIKPDNIMLTTDGVVKVADFGLVKSTEIEKDITGMGQSMLMGTPHYMSPEQFEGKIIDHRTDIYSLGVTLYYMLTGQRPYDGTTPYQIMQGHLQQEFVDPTDLSEDIYPAVAALVKKSMSRDREVRYQTCEDMMADIDKIKAGMEDGTITSEDFIVVEDDIGPTMPAAAPEAPPKKAPPAKPRKKKSLLVFAMPAVVVIATVAVLSAFLLMRGPKEENGKTVVTPTAGSEKEAGIAFERTKIEANKLADDDKFSDAMAKWDGFITKWGKEKWEDKVDIQRALLLDRAIGRIKDLLATGRKKDLEKALQEASRLNEVAPNKELATAAKEADKKLTGMESEDETRQRELKRFAEADKRGQELKNKDKLNEAKIVYEPWLKHEIDQIKTKAAERVAEIDALIAQWDEYRAADQEARNLLAANNHGEARGKYLSFTDARYLEGIRQEAWKRITEIEDSLKGYEKSQFQTTLDKANTLLDRGDYPGARKALQPYLNHPNQEFAGPAAELEGKITAYEKFAGDIKTVDSLRSSGSYDEALEIARVYAASENPDFARTGREKVMQIRAERFLGKNLVFMHTHPEVRVGSDDPRDRNPPRKVRIDYLYIDRTEVTNAQYEKFVIETNHKPPLNWRGGRPPAGCSDHPVTWVSCRDAIEYCKWRSKKEGALYRLPTESEWEYTASYDPLTKKKLKYPWGDEFDASYANLNTSTTAPVGSNKRDKSPSGLYDMAGNVSEWCTSDDRKTYVVRGASFADGGGPLPARTTFRHQTSPNTKGASIGFRCLREE